MRININNTEHVGRVSELCDIYNCSPTQLVIMLVEQAHTQHQPHAQGCNEDDKEKADIHRSFTRV